MFKYLCSQFERLLGSAPNIKKKSQDCNVSRHIDTVSRHIDTKPTTAEHMGTSSGTSVVEKVLIGGGGEKVVERARAIRLPHRLCS